mgnify:CR=1 FL=1
MLTIKTFELQSSPSKDISAPGNSIYGPYVQNQYSYKSGTSVAAAVVSSAAILLRSYFPSEDVEMQKKILLIQDALKEVVRARATLTHTYASKMEQANKEYEEKLNAVKEDFGGIKGKMDKTSPTLAALNQTN